MGGGLKTEQSINTKIVCKKSSKQLVELYRVGVKKQPQVS